MENTPEPNEPQLKPLAKKGVSIQIMFPIVDDKEAMGIKEAIDIIVEDIKEKRYTFSISEV